MTKLYIEAARHGFPMPKGLSTADAVSYVLIRDFYAMESIGLMSADEAEFYRSWAEKYPWLPESQKIELLENCLLKQTEWASMGDRQALADSKKIARARLNLRKRAGCYSRV